MDGGWWLVASLWHSSGSHLLGGFAAELGQHKLPASFHFQCKYGLFLQRLVYPISSTSDSSFFYREQFEISSEETIYEIE